MDHKVWHTSAAIKWLQGLLQERFGHAFRLQPQPDKNRIAIHLPGHARCITLALDGATYIRADSNLPCAHWKAGAESRFAAISGDLPAPGAAQLPAPLIASAENGLHIGYDILGLSYWMLTRQEEIGRTDLDVHGRFPATASHAYKHRYLERPIVDEWLNVLGEVIKSNWPTIQNKTHQFNIKVSHDVDVPSRYGFASSRRLLKFMALDILRRGNFKNALRAPWIRLHTNNAIHTSDPFNTFEWIMDLSDQHHLKSAFYFICGRTSNYDADYVPAHPAIRALMRRIHFRGHEIGLHPSYGTYQSPDALKAEADCLRRIAAEEGIEQTGWGGRMHYLRWEQPKTMRAWNDAGMTYDSTLGYADRPGFRCGTCIEYSAFDPIADESLSLRIRPLIAMETTILAPHYLGLGTGESAKTKFEQLKQSCQAVGGSFTLLWHNCQLEKQEERRLYQQLLATHLGEIVGNTSDITKRY